MIDLHCHVLPGIDDGPETLDGSLELARAAAAQGTSVLVATPHVTYDHLHNTSERILEAELLDKQPLAHSVDVEIEATDRTGLLQDILGVAAELKTTISSVNALAEGADGTVYAGTGCFDVRRKWA